jgi:hypothetical protein
MMPPEMLNPAASAKANGVRGAFVVVRPPSDITTHPKRQPQYWARILPNGEPFRIGKREAQTLGLLIEKGLVGFTSGEASPLGWARRTSDYIHRLRRKGVAIVTMRETVADGARVARYTLADRVELTAEPGKPKPANSEE